MKIVIPICLCYDHSQSLSCWIFEIVFSSSQLLLALFKILFDLRNCCSKLLLALRNCCWLFKFVVGSSQLLLFLRNCCWHFEIFFCSLRLLLVLRSCCCLFIFFVIPQWLFVLPSVVVQEFQWIRPLSHLLLP